MCLNARSRKSVTRGCASSVPVSHAKPILDTPNAFTIVSSALVLPGRKSFNRRRAEAWSTCTFDAVPTLTSRNGGPDLCTIKIKHGTSIDTLGYESTRPASANSRPTLMQRTKSNAHSIMPNRTLLSVAHDLQIPSLVPRVHPAPTTHTDANAGKWADCASSCSCENWPAAHVDAAFRSHQRRTNRWPRTAAWSGLV
ncbi:hypothetical protein IE81DRAFT_190433 [Ceraceosorus guamensis]|uniref:Uncharacterized protein n=1 Tax=Ceraceosorus guamensis TaxID=1522189 RepID=A0A316W6L5_9BASI|nr:hypothetical protein IE81DRAFT_190433 [Ceraceosorus guamensis]PWN45422.1 hypothetical protein IE81DRAFT_190433 [Ceraceosorus guamensis]